MKSNFINKWQKYVNNMKFTCMRVNLAIKNNYLILTRFPCSCCKIFFCSVHSFRYEGGVV